MSLQDLNLQEHENQFTRLPNDLLILILTKIRQQDFKFLFWCSLTSKQFASAIPLMPSVSISISPLESLNPSSDYSINSEQDIEDPFTRRKVDYWMSLGPQIQNALTFLKKFNSIQSLDVVFVTDDDDDAQKQWSFSPGLINWKTLFDFKLQRSVFLFAKTKTEKTEAVPSLDDFTAEEHELRMLSSLYACFDSVQWGKVTARLLVQHQTVREIRVGGLKPGGEIRLKSQQIVDFRNSLSSADVSRIAENRNYSGSEVDVKSAYIPVLGLPTTGYVMYSVSLVVIRAQPLKDGDTSDQDDDNGEGEDEDILNWDSVEGEEVFREAVTLILKHHKDKMKREYLD